MVGCAATGRSLAKRPGTFYGMIKSPHEGLREAGLSAAPGAIGDAPAGGAFSIFHEPWWLDIATDRRWGEARVEQGGATLGRLPYPLGKLYGYPVSTEPSLIRTLGPAIPELPGKPYAASRRRMEITHALIDQLPPLDYFEQLFDPRVADAIAFAHRGFVIGATYCFRFAQGRSEQSIWSDMYDRRRRVIRAAQAELVVAPITDVEEFSSFYDSNVEPEGNIHGKARMRTLLDAVLTRGAGLLLGARTCTGELAAAVGLVWDSSAMYYLLGTRRADLAHGGAMSLLLWEGIRLACQRGVIFDLDGITTPAALQFLAGFGGTLTQRLRVRRQSRRFRLINMPISIFNGSFARHSPKA
jgi:hypothetical protein